jgi:hypothetical protein
MNTLNLAGRRGRRTTALAVVLAVLLMLAVVPQASAAYNNESATVNGGASANVAPGASLTVSFTVQLTQGDDWLGTEYRFGTSGGWTCVNTPDHTTNGTYTESFTVTAPATVGTYTLQVRARSSNSCGGSNSSTVSPTVNVIAPVTYANPDLNGACGLKIALVLDASGSVSSSATYVRNAVTSMVNLLKDTGSQVAIVEFGTTADTPVPYTLVTASTIASVFTPYVATSGPGPRYYDGRVGQYTNWDDGLRQVNALPTPPDLVLFFTDGDPNTVHGGSGGAATTAQAIAAAVVQTDIIKNNGGNTPGTGSHIFAIGVGTVIATNFAPITDGPNYLQYVTGTPGAGQTNNFNIADYFIGAFSELQAALEEVVNALCGGTINVTKLIDADGNLATTGDQTPGVAWTFATNPDAPASSTPTSGNTNATGSVSFKINFGTGQTTATVDVLETQQTGYSLLQATCSGGTNNGTPNLPNSRVDNVQLGKRSIVTCTFINAQHNATLTVKKTALDLNGNPYCPGRTFGFSLDTVPVATFGLRSTLCPTPPAISEQTFTVRPRTYTIAETDPDINVPDGWTLVNVVCTGTGVNGDFTFAPGQTSVTGDLGPDQGVICTFTNQQESPLAVDLSYLTATESVEGVTVAWETVSEANNAGFNLYRAEAADGPWTQLNATLIAAQTPGAAQGNAYAFLDPAAVAGGTYYYVLEDVALDGAMNRHEPVSITLGAPNAVSLRTMSASAANRPALVAVFALLLSGIGLGLAWYKRQ